MTLRISLYTVAALLLGAHFLRAGNFLMLAVCAASPLLFFYRSRWSLIALQLLAYCASASWVAVAIELVRMREQLGQSWTAAAIILGSVAMFTLISGLLLNSRRITGRYPYQGSAEEA